MKLAYRIRQRRENSSAVHCLTILYSRCFLCTLAMNWDIPCPSLSKAGPQNLSCRVWLMEAGMLFILAHSHAQIWKMQQRLKFLRDWNLQFSSQNLKSSNASKNGPNWTKMVSNEREWFKERLGKASWQQNVWFICNDTIFILAFRQPRNIAIFI